MDPILDLNSALVGRYSVIREIGQGGMATVYLARDVRHDRDVALKVLRTELSAAIGAERFLVEIKVTAQLQHPNILPLFDSGVADGAVFYVMPFVQGETLRHRLRREKQLPVAQAVRIATEVAGALDYAHRHGVIHRDVKPENILLHDGRALVADFGIALAVGSATSRMTGTGMSLGTPQYMSPEQAMGEREITARSDVYALAATTYEMLVGEPPFTGATTQAIIGRVLSAAPPSITAQRHTVSPHVEAAVLTALEKLPADRYATAAEFAQALNEPVVARATSAPVTRRAPIVPIAAGLGAMLLGLTAGYIARRPVPQRSISYDQKTFQRQTIFNARMAPDGKTIAYSASSAGAIPELFVIRPDAPRPQSLGQPATHLLAISSQNELAVLVKAVHRCHRVFDGTLAILPIGGGAPREVKVSVTDADWAPDGASLAIIVSERGQQNRLEYPIGTVRYRSNGYMSDVRVSPDGRHVVFIDHPAADCDDRGQVAMLDTAGNRLTRLTPEFKSVQGAAWSPDGREIFFATDVLRAVTIDSRVREVLSGPGHLLVLDRLADSTILVAREDEVYRLFSHQPGVVGDSDYSWLDLNVRPVLSRDGRTLAFSDQSVTGGSHYSVRVRNADGRFARLGEGNAVGDSFSPDGAWLLAEVPSSPPQIVMHPTGVGTKRVVDLRGLKGNARFGGWYPDGRAILLCGSRAQAAARCYRVPVDSGALVPVTPAIPGRGFLSPDGREVAVGDRRYSGPADTGRVIPGLRDMPANRGWRVIRWSPDGRAVYAYAGPFRVDRVDVTTGRRELLLEVSAAPGSALLSLYAVAIGDDPRRYAYSAQEYSSTLFVVRGLP